MVRKSKTQKEKERLEKRLKDPFYNATGGNYKQPAEFTSQRPNYGDGDKVTRENRKDRKFHVVPANDSSYSAIVNVYALVNEAGVADKEAYALMKKQMEMHKVGKAEGAKPLSEIPQMGRTVVVPETGGIAVATQLQYVIEPGTGIVTHDGKQYVRAKTPTSKQFKWRPLIKNAAGETIIKRNQSNQLSVAKKDIAKILDDKLKSGQVSGGTEVISGGAISSVGTVGGAPISAAQAELNKALGLEEETQASTPVVSSQEPKTISGKMETPTNKYLALTEALKGKDRSELPSEVKPLPNVKTELEREQQQFREAPKGTGKIYPLDKSTLNNPGKFIVELQNPNDDEAIERILRSGANLYYIAHEPSGVLHIGTAVGGKSAEKMLIENFTPNKYKTQPTSFKALQTYRADLNAIKAGRQQSRRSSPIRCANITKAKFNRKSNRGIITGCDIPRIQNAQNIFSNRINKNVVLIKSPFVDKKVNNMFGNTSGKNSGKQMYAPTIKMPKLGVDNIANGFKNVDLNVGVLQKGKKKRNVKFGEIKVPKINLKGF